MSKNSINDLLPSLIVIGDEPLTLSNDITEQVSALEKIENAGAHDELLETIIVKIGKALTIVKKRHLVTNESDDHSKSLPNIPKFKSPQIKETPALSAISVMLMVLGGFFAIAGIAGIVIASFGVTGIAFAIVSAAAAATGVGVFSMGIVGNLSEVGWVRR